MKTSSLIAFCLAILAATLVSACGAWAGDTVLYDFGVSPDSNHAYSTPIADKYGNLYGTSGGGGSFGYGTVWMLCAPSVSGSDLYPCMTGLPNWTEFVLYNFKGPSSADGANPLSSLVFNGLYNGRAFTLYGTTYNGGKSQCSANGVNVGCGTVFELCAPSNYWGCGGFNAWQEHVLHNFLGGTDGAHPWAGLITDKASDLFGTTVYGGKKGTCLSGPTNLFCGTVFKLKGQSPWSFPETIMHHFKGGFTDGANPYAALCCNTIYGINAVYGTAQNDGANSAGMVFKVKNVPGYPETTLYSFCSLAGCPDGAFPHAAQLIFDNSGNIYGTAYSGGMAPWPGYGVVYELTPAGPPWTETVLYTFLGGPSDGGNPTAGVIFDSLGNLYGTTVADGSVCSTCGTAYKLTPAGPPWTESILQSFAGPASDGAAAFGGLTFDPAVPGGKLYGDTIGGGSSSVGIVYSVP